MFKLFIFIFLELYALSTAQELVDITITKISRTIDTDIQTTVTFDEITEGIGKIDHYHLQVIYDNGANQDQDQSLGKDATFAVFPGDLADPTAALAGQEVTFIITGQDATDKDTHWGKVKITLPDFLGADPSIGAWVGDGSGDNSLRIFPKEEIHGYQLGDIACEGDDEKSCYFVGATKDTANPLEFCQKVNKVEKAGKIDVCDSTLTFGADSDGGAAKTSAELTYPKSGTNAKVDISPAPQEIVVYKEDGTVVTVCYANPCDIGKHTPSTETNKVLVVEVTADAPTASNVLSITDYELVGTPLSTDLIETRWTRTKTINTYKVSRDGDANGSFLETSVTCNDEDNSDNFHCFAYFVGLVENTKYAMTVEKGAGDELNKITLKDTQTPAGGGGGKTLKISSLDTKWHKGLRGFEVKACVYDDAESTSSTYEAILFNKHGQWKKINEVTNISRNELCFDALHTDIYSFDLSEELKLVVVKRGQDGVTVLGSTDALVSVEGNQRVIV